MQTRGACSLKFLYVELNSRHSSWSGFPLSKSCFTVHLCGMQSQTVRARYHLLSLYVHTTIRILTLCGWALWGILVWAVGNRLSECSHTCLCSLHRRVAARSSPGEGCGAVGCVWLWQILPAVSHTVTSMYGPTSSMWTGPHLKEHGKATISWGQKRAQREGCPFFKAQGGPREPGPTHSPRYEYLSLS